MLIPLEAVALGPRMITAVIKSSSLLLTTFSLGLYCADGQREGAWGLFGRNVHHDLTVSRVYARRRHICKRRRPLVHCLKGVWVRKRLNLLNIDNPATDNEVTALIVGRGGVVRVVLRVQVASSARKQSVVVATVVVFQQC